MLLVIETQLKESEKKKKFFHTNVDRNPPEEVRAGKKDPRRDD